MQAGIYAENSGTYYVKISIHDIGMYISGITVKKSPKYGGWWVQMPYFKNYKTGKTQRYIEFDQESPIRLLIERICIEAAEEKALITRASDDILPTDDDLEKPLDLSKIPF